MRGLSSWSDGVVASGGGGDCTRPVEAVQGETSRDIVVG
jgi:hypothetical protein